MQKKFGEDRRIILTNVSGQAYGQTDTILSAPHGAK